MNGLVSFCGTFEACYVENDSDISIRLRCDVSPVAGRSGSLPATPFPPSRLNYASRLADATFTSCKQPRYNTN